ncbi:class II fructose-bisphosphate aldolase [Acidaminobacter sp. JC074]|uniref:class II fructose-bisphosphate aldolase n=1 Tax=Acidaminobacter sp. JC074 TaxID=2530199 RepID=UPI001F0FE96F|nr:class II fructose-bisphosphate aldolase [Acidaminobacter sp. JC074]MCH4889823.1 class II fructose-bisphosphate aldolase [Acidaminobacter sp. JC074]
MLVTLKEILKEAYKNKYAIAGFNVYGYEDAISVVKASEKLNLPVILMTNVDAINHMPIKILGKMLIEIAEKAKVPVVVHLDHGKTIEVVKKALEAGFSSVMYDGSALPLEENIRNTKAVVDLASKYGASVEGEIGSVGYSDPALNSNASYTDPSEAQLFFEKTGVDALAVAIGTLHRMTEQEAVIQYELLEQIEAMTHVPLVLHGSTGVKDSDLKKLSSKGICKVNIGTAIRMAFGHTMRDEFNKNPLEFDRIKLFKEPMKQVEQVVMHKMRILGGENA